jgi:predicted nuclease of predicted toxin-antitoxin system
MRVRLDLCIAVSLARALRTAGHDAERVRDGAQGHADDEVLAQALADRRVFVTADADLGGRAFSRDLPRPGIVRLVGLPLGEQARAVREALRDHAEALEQGGLVVVEPERIRVSFPPTGRHDGREDGEPGRPE